MNNHVKNEVLKNLDDVELFSKQLKDIFQNGGSEPHKFLLTCFKSSVSNATTLSELNHLSNPFVKLEYDYFHTLTGCRLNLHISAGEYDEYSNILQDSLYQVLNSDNIYISSEYVTLSEGKQTILDYMEE